MDLPTRIVTVSRRDGVALVFIDYGYGAGDQLSASFPTGAYAAYPEAIESNRLECEREIAAHIAEMRERCPDLTVVNELPQAPERACPCGEPEAAAVHDPWVSDSHQPGTPPARSSETD